MEKENNQTRRRQLLNGIIKLRIKNIDRFVAVSCRNGRFFVCNDSFLNDISSKEYKTYSNV